MTNTNQSRTPKIGEIYLMKFDGSGSEQSGWRPGLVFQNNVGNRYSPNIIALPLTGANKKFFQPTHVFVSAEDTGLHKDSMVLCENPQRMAKERIGKYLTTLPQEYMQKVAAANLLASSAISYLSPEVLLTTWLKAVILNTNIVSP